MQFSNITMSRQPQRVLSKGRYWNVFRTTIINIIIINKKNQLPLKLDSNKEKKNYTRQEMQLNNETLPEITPFPSVHSFETI